MGTLEGKWTITIKYDFYYNVERCKEEWLGTDLYWQWDWFEKEYWNAEITIGQGN